MAGNGGKDTLRNTSETLVKPVVVAIGASAGGVQALQMLFESIPDQTGAAFVVVIHLDPAARSEMSSILAARTRMPVLQVTEAVQLQANHVYVIPPDRRLLITDNEIAAHEFDEPRGKRAPIDFLFRSLADQHGDGCAVILTGAGSDGAMGVRAIKEAGGIIFVQDPHEAEYPSMPRSAIATGFADFILPVQELAERLTEVIQEKARGEPVHAGKLSEDVLRRILAHVRVRTGHDFSQYKRATMLRRIARRMQVTRAEDPTEYYDILRDTPEEAQALLGDLLISVTTFFRDSEAFEALRLQVLPHLFATKTANDVIRVWVPGCATGEEAYTISMLLLEEASRRDIRPAIQVFASDLDSRALTTAREGRFPSSIETDVSEDRLRRYFLREGDHYLVRQELRDTVLFASHSMLKDPPFSRVDLVSCRNVLIYLDRELQEQAFSTFHYALVPNGYLLLGSSESAENPPGLFRVVDRKSRIFQAIVRKDQAKLLPRLLGNLSVLHGQAAQTGRAMSSTAVLSEAASHRRALEKQAPPNIIVDSTHRVIHLSENAGRFLQPAGGPLSGDVLDLVRSELRFELRSALHNVFENQKPVLSLPILVRFNGAAHRVLIHVQPVDGENNVKFHQALILFMEEEAAAQTLAETIPSAGGADEGVIRLREELQLTQSRLRTTREEAETTNEELRAANEELQSINEEYRSTSEELETSKEELQSINEELQTVNSELKLKLETISRAHGDLQNLMAATEFGTLFLDSKLRIKRYTQAVTEIFRITPHDEGRPLSDFAHRLEYDGLIKDAEAVLHDLAPIKHEVRSRDNRWYDVRLRPYRTVDNKIDGVVISIIDVTERHSAEESRRQSERELRQEKHLVELSRDPIFIWDYDGGIVSWNRGSEELYGYSREEALGKQKDRLLSTTVPGSSFAELRANLLEEGHWDGEVRHVAKDGKKLSVESRIILETIEGRRLALESTRDVTERKAWEEQQRLLLRELTHRVKNTLAVVQAIAHQTQRHKGSPKDFVERFDGRLAALADAHTLLVESDWKGADLGTLARKQLEPYMSKDSGRVKISGEPMLLPADLATSFGLVLHELATNAVKHGALSRRSGTVSLHWTLTGGATKPKLKVEWRENGGPIPKEHGRSAGFGSILIEKGIPAAEISREYLPEGLVCVIELPYSALSPRPPSG